MALSELSALEGISLIGTGVTVAGADRFNQKLPECDLVIESTVATPKPADADGENPFAVPAKPASPPLPPRDEQPKTQPSGPQTELDRVSTELEALPNIEQEPMAEPLPSSESLPTLDFPATESLPKVESPVTESLPKVEIPVAESLPMIELKPESQTRRAVAQDRASDAVAAKPHVQPAGAWPQSIDSPVPQQTREELSSLLRRKLQDPEVLEVLGAHLMSQRRYEEAAQAFASSLQLQPEAEEPRFQLAVALARSGRYDESLPHFRRVVGEAAAHYNVGIIAYEREEAAIAERYFAAAVAADPRLADSEDWQERHRQVARPSGSAGASSIEQGDVLELLSTALGTSTPAATTARSQSLGIEIIPNRPAAAERLVQKPIEDGRRLR